MSIRNSTVKRIMKEASELSASPSPDFAAAPLESDVFEWHFTIRGPPAPSPFAGGVYHGRIALPPSYPLRPPSFRFLTPSGRFEVNREICLSISGFHEETWQPAWGIRTALVAIRSFMDSDAGGAVGSMNADEGVRKRLAAESVGWRCNTCGKTNADVMAEQERLCQEVGGGAEGKQADVVPEELRLGYREDLAAGKSKDEEATEAKTQDVAPAAEAAKEVPVDTKAYDAAQEVADAPSATRPIRLPRAVPARMPIRRPAAVSSPAAGSTAPITTPAPTRTQPVQRPQVDTGTLDKVIAATAGALIFMVIRLLFF
ncbi:hypothetical protein ANO11243_086300 [Dothideomycetidae sp. 11243]|nr:hypothetical protein ANO11243_086300 [fungal sp. No.11243]